jgi:hypothetical protein
VAPGPATTDAEPFDYWPGNDPAAETEPVPNVKRPIDTPLDPASGPALVRPYIARHIESDEADPVLDARDGSSARHGLDPTAFVPTAELPSVQLTDDDFPPQAPGGATGRQRRKAAFVLMAVVLVLTAIVVSVVLVVGRGPGAQALPSPSGPDPNPITNQVLPDPTSPGSVPSSISTPDPTTGLTPTSSSAAADPSGNPTSPSTPAPTPTPTLTLPPAPDATGRITSAIDGRCLALNRNNQSPGTAVKALECDETSSDEWTLEGGTIRIDNTLCLQPADQATVAGTGLVVGTCDGSAAQQWRPTDGVIKHLPTGLCLTIPPNASSNAALTIDTCTGATGQRWTIP